MPFPMIHLAIADKIGRTKGQPASPNFLLGSISPDAIHKREGSDRAAKNATHLLPREDGFLERIADLWLRSAIETPTKRAFTGGYIAHLLTDRFWVQKIMKPLWARLDPMEQSEKNRLYYQEADQVDFDFYNHAAWQAQTWCDLEEAVAPDFEPLLYAHEIDQWRIRTLRWFGELKEEPKIEPQYLTSAVVDNFVSSAADHVIEQLDGICGSKSWL